MVWLALPLLVGCSHSEKEQQPPSRAPVALKVTNSPAAASPANASRARVDARAAGNSRLGGIDLVKGRSPHVVVTVENRYDNTARFSKQTPWGAVHVVWKKPPPYMVDGVEGTPTMQSRTVGVDSPRRLPVILRVHFWPNFKDHDDVIGVQVNGGEPRDFAHSREPLHEYGILRLHGGHSTVEWAE
jgi:hypothetical protein